MFLSFKLNLHLMSLEIAVNKVQKFLESGFTSLDLSSLNLKELPPNLKEAKKLKRLNISSNELDSLPDWLNQLTELETLDLRSNNLTSLINFEGLQKLNTLHLRFNKIKEIPNVIFKLKGLQYINLANNRIEKLPSTLFDIEYVNVDYNPIIDPPIEVYTRGSEAIKNYFRESSIGTDTLYEAKLLIVGEPGAGKTTLMNKILDENYTLNFYESSTKGIQIKPHYFKVNEEINFRINIWDFGGQEIYHTTHQFFLTKRSLYILLSDNRAENTDFNYWLQSIELLSGDSPLLLMLNEKHDRKYSVNESGMRERFRSLKRIFSFNLGDDKGQLRSLVKEIEYQVSNLSHIGTELPKIWIAIRKALEQKSKTDPYISDIEYLELCKSFGMIEKDRAWFLSDYFHDLGVFIHFKDNPVLKRWIILTPEWGTEAVYKVLDNKDVIGSNGYFDRKDLEKIWNNDKYADMHDELISLMMKFELCYQIEYSNTYIAAQLLQVEKPLYLWDNNENIICKYDYEFMPKGILTRFIVRMHDYIKDQKTVWREGVLLFRSNTWAEIIETYGKNEIRIRVRGENKKEFLAIILDSIDRINLTYSNLKVKKLIPCNCEICKTEESKHYFEYNLLKQCLVHNIKEERCNRSFKMVKILPLIDDILGKTFEGKGKKLEIFISYNDSDENGKKEFLKHLAALERSNKVRIDDKTNVPAGENEKLFIRDKLDTADVILCLISANYFNSEINYSEMIKAMDRSETKSCLFIPIILKECDWKSLPIGSIKPILYKGKALLSGDINIDSALVHAVNQIKDVINIYLNDPELPVD